MFKIVCIETLHKNKEKYVINKGMLSNDRMAAELCLGRYNSVMKILQPGQTFWFYKGYHVDATGNYYSSQNVTPENFFINVKTKVSICSIVAENGMGKSSLLELYFRLINNVSYALRDGLPVQKNSLCFVRDIYAKLVFELDYNFFYLEQKDGIITYHDQTNPDADWLYDYDNATEQNLVENDAKNKLRKLFYTIVVNYAQYAYNTSDYIAEWDDRQDVLYSNDNPCWINSLFHKNDHYQTPIVLNPFREKGNLNINVERDLTHKRLFQLVMTNPELLSKVLRNKKAKSFVFDVDDDLNPVGRKRYSSRRVLRMMVQMNIIHSMEFGIETNEVEDIGKRITTAWKNALGNDIELKSRNNYKRNMDIVRTINYIVYKTLKISNTYAQYYKYKDCFSSKKLVQEYVLALSQDNSHITLKIRKCLGFLNFEHYSTGHIEDGHIVGNEMDFNDFDKAIKCCLKTKPSPKTCASFHIWQLEELLPAPSFRADILLEDDENNLIRFSSLSSGEKQMIYSLCTVMYQLSNISSVWDNPEDGSVKYRNVNIAFDEIELYSHPKYQLMLVDMVLSSIQSLELVGVLNVNIMIATHSPFILSDLPSSNILCLDSGKPAEDKRNINNSFCANVYDILNNQFFMSRFVGDFAAAKLDKMIEESKQDNLTPEQKNNLLKRISYIGDSFIKGLLEKKLNVTEDK